MRLVNITVVKWHGENFPNDHYLNWLHKHRRMEMFSFWKKSNVPRCRRNVITNRLINKTVAIDRNWTVAFTTNYQFFFSDGFLSMFSGAGPIVRISNYIIVANNNQDH